MSHRARPTVIIVVLLMFTSIVLDANVAAQTPSAAISRFKAGVKENQQRNFDLAIEEFTMAIEISSHPTQRFSGKRALSNSPEASAELRSIDKPKTVTLLDPFTALAYANRGFAWYGKGDFARGLKNELEAAIRDFSRALELDPKLALAYENRGLTFLLQSNEAAAKQDFERCPQLIPA